MNNTEYKVLVDNMVKHQIKNAFKLTLELISHRATDLHIEDDEYNKDYSELKEAFYGADISKPLKYNPSTDSFEEIDLECMFEEDVEYNKDAEYNKVAEYKDARVEYLKGELFNRAMDIEDDEESETLKSYISVMVFDNSMPATPPQYADFKMNSVDYQSKYNSVMEQLISLRPEYFGVSDREGGSFVCKYFGGDTPEDGWINDLVVRHCDFARVKTILRLSYNNYLHNGQPDNRPVNLNRRYEVMFVRYILYLELNTPTTFGHILCSALPPSNTRLYITEYNRVKRIIKRRSCEDCGGDYDEITNGGLKPITVAGFKRLCVDRELICVWKASTVYQPLHIS